MFIDSPLSGKIQFFVDGKVSNHGSEIPLAKRDAPTIYPFVDFIIEAGERKTIYIKRTGSHTFATRVYLTDPLGYFFYKTNRENSFRYYVGAILALIIYNLMLVIFFKNKNYIIYCLFALSFLLVVLNLHGVLDYIDIFPNSTFSNYLIVSSSFALMMAVLMGENFLSVKEKIPELNSSFKIMFFLPLTTIFAGLTPLYSHYIVFWGYLIDIYILLGLSLLIVAAFIALKRKVPLAAVYIASWSCLFIAALLYYGNTFGLFPKIFITEFAFLIANVLEMIILSLGLGYQVAVIDKYTREAMIKAEGKERYQQLLRVISHDILNSMQVVQLSLRRLRKFINEEKLLKYLEKIDRSNQHMYEILEQVKGEEKLISDSENLKLSKVNLKQVVNENIQIFEDKLLAKNIIVTTSISYDAQWVWAEKISLKNSVLGNLFSNAIKFSEYNGEIHIRSFINGDKTVLQFKDSGTGLSQEALNYINGENTEITFSTHGTEGESGTGFGLRILKSYILMYGAEMIASNDDGAIFEISFNH